MSSRSELESIEIDPFVEVPESLSDPLIIECLNLMQSYHAAAYESALGAGWCMY